MNFRFPQCVATPLESIVTTISKDGLKLMSDMLLWNPEKRPTAAGVGSFLLSERDKSLTDKYFQSLKYKYFQVGQKLGAPVAIVQPQIAVKASSNMQDTQLSVADRKPSAESTQSDSKLVVRRAPNKVTNLADSLLASNGAKTDRPAPLFSQKQPDKPKMERQFNRNIALNKSTNAFEKK